MDARMDHVVFWVEDPLRSLEFYEKVVGFAGVRADEFRAEQAPFPSVRVSAESIIDLMPRVAASLIDSMFAGEGASGNRVSHLCVTVSKGDYAALRARLQTAGVALSMTLEGSYGARGPAPEAFYFLDPDGNVIEARYYSS